ncbi:MAG: AGE family epimerase/isomerase [Phycisphaerales bacterium]|jgi:N-acylglucosamine 2-epimerase|nr:AGE family epimerase/isomerase [Phycisphaerales bacterium]
MNAEQIAHYLAIYRDGLLKDVVPFWQRHAPDRECGGFLTFLDADGSVVGTDKPIWVAGRATWLFSTLYNNVEKRPEWLELAAHGLDFLRRHAFDRDGRMYYSVTRDGRPLRKRRYLFSESFGVIAFAEYAKAAQDAAAGQKAKDIYQLMLRYHNTPGLLEPKIIPQTRQLKGHAMPMIFMAITQVLRQIDPKNPLYREVIDHSLHEIRDHFLKPQFKMLLENVGPWGEFLDEPMGRVVNPGHAIESSWFIMEEARHRRDRDLLSLALQILDWHLECGWDNEYGGILYFIDCKGKPCEQYEHDMKLWWPHNEAIYATLLAHHLTGDEKYLHWHKKLHDWAYAHFPDRTNGEWFGYLHRDGSLSSPLKGNMWKGPFHLPRMLLYCWKLLEQMKPGYAEAARWP